MGTSWILNYNNSGIIIVSKFTIIIIIDNTKIIFLYVKFLLKINIIIAVNIIMLIIASSIIIITLYDLRKDLLMEIVHIK